MANRYWVGDSGTWDRSDTTHWSASSGGAGGASIPGLTDNAIFDANSFSADGKLVTINDVGSPFPINTLDTSAISFTATINFVDFNTLNLYGDLTLSNKLTLTSTFSNAGGILFNNSIQQNITLNGATSSIFFVFASGGAGPFVLQGDFIAPNSNLELGPLTGATLDANGFNISCKSLKLKSNFFGAGTLTMGSGTWTIASGFTVESPNPNAPTISAGTSTLSTGSFINTGGGNYTFYNVIITGNCTFFGSGNITFNNLTLTAGTITNLVSSKTFTVNGAFTANGSSDSLITLLATIHGTQTTLSAATVSISFVNVIDNLASGVASPFTDTNGIDSGNNTNWIFTFQSQFLGVI